MIDCPQQLAVIGGAVDLLNSQEIEGNRFVLSLRVLFLGGSS